MFQKKIIISGLTLCASLILAGCSGINSDNTFENNKKCADTLEKYEKEYVNTEGKDITSNVEEVFFSKSRRSCLIYLQEINQNLERRRIVIDILSRKELCITYDKESYYGSKTEFTESQESFEKCIEENR